MSPIKPPVDPAPTFSTARVPAATPSASDLTPGPGTRAARRHAGLLTILLALSLGFPAGGLPGPAAGSACEPTADPDDPAPLNIVFLFADDWGRHASIYAALSEQPGVNDVLETPHFDRLACDGVLFRHAHVSAPSCTPCRSAILSGQHFYRTGRGAILLGALWDDSIPTYPLLLREHGYHIGFSYKVWRPGNPPDAPHGGADHRYNPGGQRFNSFSQHVTRRITEGLTMEQAKEELHEEVRVNFRAFMADREPGQPFCYWWGPTNVHRSWIQGSGKALWGIDPDDLEDRMPPFLPDVHEVREDLADYFGEVQAFDAGVGVLLEELRASGEWERTLIVISGDHGAPGFPYGKCNLYDFGTGVPLAIAGPGVRGGRVVTDFVNLADLAPTFLEAAGIEPPEVMTGRSLWPLLASDQEGQVDPTRDHVITGRERHVDMARKDYLPYPQRAIRTAGHSFIINFKPDRWPLGDPYRLDGDNPPTVQELKTRTFVTLADEDAGPTKAWLVMHRDHPDWRDHFDWVYGKRAGEELYDLAADPYETINLANDPEYADIRDRMRARLLAELEATGDPRLVDDGAYFENPPLAGPPEL